MTGGSKTEPLELNYSTQPPSRRWLRTFVLLAGMIAVITAIRLARGPYERWQARRAYARQAAAWYAAASTHAGKSGQLKYSEVASDASLPGARRRVFANRPTDIIFRDKQLDLRPMSAWGGVPVLADDWPVVFTHERTSDVGVKRLIVVSYTGWKGATTLELQTDQVGRIDVGDYAGMYHLIRSDPGAVDMSAVPGAQGRLRLYDGQADPSDATRILIPFEAGGVTGRLVGVYAGGRSTSNDPAIARIERQATATVRWSVEVDPPATQPAR
jgi:hypothetical protein